MLESTVVPHLRLPQPSKPTRLPLGCGTLVQVSHAAKHEDSQPVFLVAHIHKKCILLGFAHHVCRTGTGEVHHEAPSPWLCIDGAVFSKITRSLRQTCPAWSTVAGAPICKPDPITLEAILRL